MKQMAMETECKAGPRSEGLVYLSQGYQGFHHGPGLGTNFCRKSK